MSFVPECSSYFVHKIERLSLRRSRSRGVFAPDQVQMRHLSQATRFAIFHPERSLFSVYMIDTRMKFRRPRKRISFAMETGKNTLRNVLYGKEMSFQYRVIKIRTEKYIMELPNELVPVWKSFRYHVNSPLTSSPEGIGRGLEGEGDWNNQDNIWKHGNSPNLRYFLQLPPILSWMINPHVLRAKNLLVPCYSWDQYNWLAFQSRSKHGKRHRCIPRLDQSNSCLKQANHMWRKVVKLFGKWNWTPHIPCACGKRQESKSNLQLFDNLIIQSHSTLSKTDTFGNGTKCPS